jgi:hypothetical protein
MQAMMITLIIAVSFIFGAVWGHGSEDGKSIDPAGPIR